MKHACISHRILLAFGAAALVRATAASFVQETPTSFHAAGDFNGDGHPDALVVERPSGLARIALGSPAGDIWTPPLAGGIPDTAAVAVGRLLDADRDSWAATSPRANRIQILGYHAGAATAPRVINPASTGQDALAALRVGGPGADETLDDLAVASSLNMPHPHALELLRNEPIAAFSAISSFVPVPVHLRVHALQPLRVSRAAAVRPMLMHLLKAPGEASRVQIHDVSNGLASPGAPTDEWSPGGEVGALAAGFFGSPAVPRVLAYTPGQTAFASHALKQSIGDGFFFTGDGPELHSFPAPPAALTVIPRPAPESDRLLVFFNDVKGEPLPALLMDFDGFGNPMLVSEILPPPGAAALLGAVPDGSGGFLTLGADPEGRLVASRRHDSTGKVREGSERQLDTADPLRASANVLFYDRDPELHNDARLLGTRAAGDWARDLNLQGGNASVWAESFAGGLTGLAGGGMVSLGATPAGTAGGRANHPDADSLPAGFGGSISYYTFAPALGPVTLPPGIEPAPGAYREAVQVSFNVPEGTFVRFRKYDPSGPSSGPWYFYQPDSDPLWITEDTRIEYYAVRDSLRSEILTATYQVDVPDGDSIGDRLPDLVRLGFGLDPAGETDSDGDGVSDIIELLYGTDALDPSRTPFAAGVPEAMPGAEWGSASVRIQQDVVDGLRHPLPGITWPLKGTIMTVNGTNGEELGTGEVIGNGPAAVAMVRGIASPEGRPYLALRSPEQFSVWHRQMSAVEIVSGGGDYSRDVKATVPSLPGTVLSLETKDGVITGATIRKSGTIEAEIAHPVLLSEIRPNAAILEARVEHGNFGREMLGLMDPPVAYQPVFPPPPAGSSRAEAEAWLAEARTLLGIQKIQVQTILRDEENGIVLTTAPHGLSVGDIIVIADALGMNTGPQTAWNNGFVVRSVENPVVFQIDAGGDEIAMGGFLIPLRPTGGPAAADYRLTFATTVAALAYERVLGYLLGISEPTLFPSRALDTGRSPVLAEDLLALRRPGPGGRPAHLAGDLRARMEEALLAVPPHPAVQPLLSAALKIYQTHSTRVSEFDEEPDLDAWSADPDNYQAPPAFAAPVDAIREILATGEWPEAYREALQPDAVARAALQTAVAYVRAMPMARSLETLHLMPVEHGMSVSCTLLQTIGSGKRYALVDEDGDPWPLEASFRVRPGMRFRVTGYRDLGPAACNDATLLEVVTIEITRYPRLQGEDADGNLLADSWQDAFVPSGDPMDWLEINGRLFRRLQVYLEGSDPLTGSAVDAIGPIEVGPPVVHIDSPAPAMLRLAFDYPPRYAPMLRFPLQASAGLAGFQDVPGTQAQANDPARPGSFQNLLPRNDPESRRFFRYAMEWK
jgi:hypothetical protein